MENSGKDLMPLALVVFKRLKYSVPSIHTLHTQEIHQQAHLYYMHITENNIFY